MPVPPRGYWAKVQAGHKVPRPTLPALKHRDIVEVTGSSGRVMAKAADATVAPPADAIHPLLRNATELFTKGRTFKNGYLRPAKRALPDIFASDTGLANAVKVADAIYKEVERRKHAVGLARPSDRHSRPRVDHGDPSKAPDERSYVHEQWEPDRPTLAVVKDVIFGISIFELSEVVAVETRGERYIRKTDLPVPKRRHRQWQSSWVHTHAMPTGRMCIRVYGTHHEVPFRREWVESQPGDLLSKARGIVRTMEEEAPELAERIAEANRQAEIRHQRWLEERARQEEKDLEERRQKAVKDSRDQLLGIVEHWARAKRIEEFFGDAEARASASADSTDVLRRVAAARTLLGGTDALARLAVWKSPEELHDERETERRARRW